LEDGGQHGADLVANKLTTAIRCTASKSPFGAAPASAPPAASAGAAPKHPYRWSVSAAPVGRAGALLHGAQAEPQTVALPAPAPAPAPPSCSQTSPKLAAANFYMLYTGKLTAENSSTSLLTTKFHYVF
jgi:hypothetical protein